MNEDAAPYGTEQVQSSNYILYTPSWRWPSSKTVIEYSFNDYIFTSSDTTREGKLGLALRDNWRDIVRDAMAEWERVSGVEFREVADAPDVDVRIGWMSYLESDGPGGTLGTAWAWSYGAGATKMAIGFDLADTWDSVSFWDTALHEVGHVVGIDHSNVSRVVMSGPPTTSYHNQPGRDQLQPDDIAAAQALWGQPGGTAPGLGGPGLIVDGGPLADTLNGGKGDDNIYGYGGNDSITGNFGADIIYGGDGNDTLNGNGKYWTHYFNPQDNYWSRTYNGYDDSDTIYGGWGDDVINGNAGTDSLDGGPGDDTILGGQNQGTWTAGTTRTNTVHLREGWDTLKGGSGDDYMNGNMGSDLLWGESGNDWMHGGQDHDSLYGGPGDDTVVGDLEGDWLNAGMGYDVVVAGNSLYGGDGAVDSINFLSSDYGYDLVYGFESHDLVYIDGVRSTKAAAEALGHVFIPLGGA